MMSLWGGGGGQGDDDALDSSISLPPSLPPSLSRAHINPSVSLPVTTARPMRSGYRLLQVPPPLLYSLTSLSPPPPRSSFLFITPVSFFPDSSDDENGEGVLNGQDNGEEGGLARRTRARLNLGDAFDFNKADEELGIVVQQLEDDNKTQARAKRRS